MELENELNDPRVVAGGNDLPKITRAVRSDLAGVADRSAGLAYGVEIADRVRKIDGVQKIENVHVKCKSLRLRKRETLADRQVNIELSRSA